MNIKNFQKGDWVIHNSTGRIGRIMNISKPMTEELQDNSWSYLAIINFIPVGGDNVGLTRLDRQYDKLEASSPKLLAAKEWAKILYDEVIPDEY